jgi:hypothetical protein
MGLKEFLQSIFDEYYGLKKCKTKEEVESLLKSFKESLRFCHYNDRDKIAYLEGALEQELPSETRKAVCEYLFKEYLRHEALDKARGLFDYLGQESKEALLQAHLKANQLDHAEQLAKKMGQDAGKYLPGLLEKSVLSDRWDIVERTEKREKYLPDIFEKYLELDRWDVVNKMVEKDKSLEALLNEKRQGWIESVKKFSEKRTRVKRTKVEETAKEPTKIAYIPHWMGRPKKIVTEHTYYAGNYIKEIEKNINIEAFNYLASVSDVWLFYKEEDELWAIFASFLGRFTHDVDRRPNINREFFLCAREKDDADKSLSVIATTLKLNEKINELRQKYSYLLNSDNPPKEDDIYEMELVDNPVKGKLSKKMFKLEKPKKFYEEGIEWYIINPQLPEHILKIYKEVKNNKIVLLSEEEFGEWSEKWWYRRLSEKEIKPFLISSEIGKEGSDDWEEEEWREYIDEFYKLSLDEYEKYSPIIKNKDIESLCRLDNQALKKLAAVAEAYEKEKK